MQIQTTTWWPVGWLAITLILALGCALYATIPPSPDQWFLDYTGWVTATGGVPYHSFADGNWPACNWLHALSTTLLGNTPYSWRVFDFCLMLCCTAAAAYLNFLLWGKAASVWTLLLYPCLYITTGMWFAGQRDIVAGNLLFVALLCYWLGVADHGRYWQVGTGVVIAVAVLVKPTFVLLAAFLAIHAACVVLSGQLTWREAALQVAAVAGGLLVGLGLGFAVVFWQGTSPAMFWEMAVESVVVRYGNDSRSLWQLITTGATRFWTSWHWVFVGAVLTLATSLVRAGRDGIGRNLLFPALWLTGVASYLLQVQGLYYTLGAILAATVPILCCGLGYLWDRFSGFSLLGRVVAGTLILIAVLGTAKKWVGSFGSSAQVLVGVKQWQAHYSSFEAGDGINTSQAIDLAKELEARVPCDGHVLVWGRANAINYLAKRRQPTRFHHNVTIIRQYLPDRLKKRWNRWFISEIKERRPEAALVNERQLYGLPPPIPDSARFLRDFLARNYEADRRVGDSVLYFRREG